MKKITLIATLVATMFAGAAIADTRGQMTFGLSQADGGSKGEVPEVCAINVTKEHGDIKFADSVAGAVANFDVISNTEDTTLAVTTTITDNASGAFTTANAVIDGHDNADNTAAGTLSVSGKKTNHTVFVKSTQHLRELPAKTTPKASVVVACNAGIRDAEPEHTNVQK